MAAIPPTLTVGIAVNAVITLTEPGGTIVDPIGIDIPPVGTVMTVVLGPITYATLGQSGGHGVGHGVWYGLQTGWHGLQIGLHTG